MVDKNEILFKHGINLGNMLVRFILIAGIIMLIRYIYIRGLDRSLTFIILLIVYILSYIVLEIIMLRKDKFSITKKGFNIPTNTLYPLFKQTPKNRFVPFSEIKDIDIKYTKLYIIISIKTKDGNKYQESINNLMESDQLLKILNSLNLDLKINIDNASSR